MANTWFFIFLDCFLFPSKDSFFFFNGFTTVFVDKDRPQIDQNFQQEKKEKETFEVMIAEDQKRKRTQKNFEKGKKQKKNKKEKNKF